MYKRREIIDPKVTIGSIDTKRFILSNLSSFIYCSKKKNN